MQIIIHTSRRSNRLDYILDLIFDEHLNLGYAYAREGQEYGDSDIHIAYGRNIATASAINIPAHGLLFESDIRIQEIHVRNHMDLPCFFHIKEVSSSDKALPFDLFALCFYLISRYEEYLDFKGDHHKRFTAGESLAGQYNFLTLPLVDLWILEIKKHIEKISRKSIQLNRIFQRRISFDIDQVYAFKHKPVAHLIGGAFKDLFCLRWNTLVARWTYLSSGKDPFDQYDYICSVCRNLKSRTLIFVLCRYQKPYDENNLVHHPSFNTVIDSLRQYFKIGIHPSYSSNLESSLKEEIEILEGKTQQSITSSRQHFLILQFPSTYKKLISLGIQEDHSMIYSDRIGFRASTSIPFKWFDLIADSATQLVVHPYVAMDVTLRYYQKWSPVNARLEMNHLIQSLKDVQGNFGIVWHNSSLSSAYGWGRWKNLFESLLDEESDKI